MDRLKTEFNCYLCVMININLFISNSSNGWIMFNITHNILWDVWKEQILFEEIAKWSHIWYHICLQGHGYPYVVCCVCGSLSNTCVSYAWLTSVITPKPFFGTTPCLQPSDVNNPTPQPLPSFHCPSTHIWPPDPPVPPHLGHGCDRNIN